MFLACSDTLDTHLALLDAVLLGDCARVELSDRLVLEQVTAADLAVPLVGAAVARLQADDVGETPVVTETAADKRTSRGVRLAFRFKGLG